MGVYRPDYVELVSEAVTRLDMEHVVVAHGVDGLDEVSILGPTAIAEIRRDRVERYEVTPEDFGLQRATFDDVRGGDPAFNAGVIRDIFEGRDHGPRRDFVVLNNGFTLYVAGAAESPERGIALAEENIDSGAASQKLVEFAEASNAITAATT